MDKSLVARFYRPRCKLTSQGRSKEFILTEAKEQTRGLGAEPPAVVGLIGSRDRALHRGKAHRKLKAFNSWMLKVNEKSTTILWSYDPFAIQQKWIELCNNAVVWSSKLFHSQNWQTICYKTIIKVSTTHEIITNMGPH